MVSIAEAELRRKAAAGTLTDSEAAQLNRLKGKGAAVPEEPEVGKCVQVGEQGQPMMHVAACGADGACGTKASVSMQDADDEAGDEDDEEDEEDEGEEDEDEDDDDEEEEEEKGGSSAVKEPPQKKHKVRGSTNCC